MRSSWRKTYQPRQTYPHLGARWLLVQQVTQCLVKVVIPGRLGDSLQEASRIIQVFKGGKGVRVPPEFISRGGTQLLMDCRPQSACFSEFSGSKLQPDECGESMLSRTATGSTATDGFTERI